MKDQTSPVFPDLFKNRDGDYYLSGGMTIRQWYAGMAMQGFMDAYARQEIDDMMLSNYAQLAFIMADAMLAQEDK